MCSALEGSNQIVSDQGVRKNLYQKVCRPVGFQTTAMANDILDCGCVPGRLAVLGPDFARSERDEEEIREGGDGERLNERSSASSCVVCLTHRTLLLLRFVCAFAPLPRAFVF